jgi:hypothetical protein
LPIVISDDGQDGVVVDQKRVNKTMNGRKIPIKEKLTFTA